MLKRCLICGKKINQDTGECTGNKCPFKDPSKELQKNEVTYNKEGLEKSS